MNGLTMALVASAMVAGALIWWFRRVRRVAIPKNRVPFVLWMLVGGILAAAAIAAGGGWIANALASLALLGSLFALFTASISRQKTEGAISVGDSIPAFQAVDENGKAFDSVCLAGQTVLFKFFRGHW